ncbi:hypothetical protein [Elongatibacter sediminis]|uniref:Zinc-regulated TonB-dependent outer membrane receptor n=1 Tax=Elongatibacter sediminis TaxID=3119006 RepID=A0AAW9RG26_9GAMM
MKCLLQSVLLACVAMTGTSTFAAEPQPNDVQVLREELNELRNEYETRIADLERRLNVAEQSAREANNAAELAQNEAREAKEEAASSALSAPASRASGVSVAPDNSFNPAIGVIFQGQAWAYGEDPESYAVPGFPLGGEAGPVPEGFSLAETELNISANVDDKFTAWLTLPVVYEDGEAAVEIEEAWVETLALPAGLSLRLGRSYSNIGYLNNQHSHSWDFTDQPLPYQAFLGGQYLDDGLQLRWLAPTPVYLELSGELVRGDRYPAGGAVNSGVGAYTLSARSGGDVGISHSWLAGFSWLHAEAEGRESGDEDDPLGFDGETDLYIASFVWKWAPYGNWRERNFKLQAEYLWRDEDGDYALPDGFAAPWRVSQRGWYVQAVFQPFPQWRFGARIDQLETDLPSAHWVDTPLFPGSGDPKRYSMMVDWSNSEFSRLRFQYNRDESAAYDDDQFGLQYIHSIGAHGAHTF